MLDLQTQAHYSNLMIRLDLEHLNYYSERPKRMKHIKTVAILGAGALGGAYAGMLFEMDPSCVTLVAGGERYERLKEKGLIINGKHYHFQMIRPEDRSEPSDVIFVALKHQHLHAAAREIKNRVGEKTMILSVMNGLGSEDYLASLYGKEKVLFGVSVGIDALRTGNRTRYTKQGKLFFGEARNEILSEKVQRLQELFDRAGIVYETPQDMLRILWWKFMINVGINQSSAILRAPYGVFQTSKDAQALMESAMREVIAVAKAARINLVDNDLDGWYSFLHTLSPQGKTSMLQDIEACRKSEVEMFAGKMVVLGRQHGIPTPVNETFLRIIRAIEASQA